MSVNTLHNEYEVNAAAWSRARDVLSGEDAVKARGERYLPRLLIQSLEEYEAYKERAAFFNATARTAEGFCGLVFRRMPFIKLPAASSRIGQALSGFGADVDLRGTPLVNYAREIVSEVVAVGRAGTLVDWAEEAEQRVYAVRYAAENILNWRVERIQGRNLVTLVVLYEPTGAAPLATEDKFTRQGGPQIRVLELVTGNVPARDGDGNEPERMMAVRDVAERKFHYQVEVWQEFDKRPGTSGAGKETEWVLVDRRVPRRFGRPLPQIPFVFHGPRHSQPEVDKPPLADMITVNLDHYRLDADYKHGLHFTALPTAWVSGFEKGAKLQIGSSTAWVTENTGAMAGFLEFKGQGLETFERAMDRDERLMAVLGSRLLENQKRVGETAQAIELRQSGEESILANLARSVSASLSAVLRWAYWWNSTEATLDQVSVEQVALELNTDFSVKGLSAQELQAIVASWQAKALSRDSMMDLLRRGEVLPEGRTNEEELRRQEEEFEDRGRRTDDRGPRTEDRGPRSEDRGQRTEGGSH